MINFFKVLIQKKSKEERKVGNNYGRIWKSFKANKTRK